MDNYIKIVENNENEQSLIDLQKVEIQKDKQSVILTCQKQLYILLFKNSYKKEMLFKELQTYQKVAKDSRRLQKQRVLLKPKEIGKGKNKKIDYWEIEFIQK